MRLIIWMHVSEDHIQLVESCVVLTHLCGILQCRHHLVPDLVSAAFSGHANASSMLADLQRLLFPASACQSFLLYRRYVIESRPGDNASSAAGIS